MTIQTANATTSTTGEIPASSVELGDLVLRPYREGDEYAILPAFNRVFAQVDDAFRPRDLAEWRWRFRANPAGHRIWIATTPHGEVAAQQAGMPLRVRMGETRRGDHVALWNHVVDSFADPRFGKGLKKPGLFVSLVHAYNDAVGGWRRGQVQAMVGMPVRSAYRIGRRFLQYRAVRNQLQLRAPLDRVDAAPSARVVLSERADFPDEVEALFRRLAPRHAAIAVRDVAFLDWRFVRRPGVQYRIATARRAGELVGYAVFRPGAFDGRAAGLACDWLVDPDEPEARRTLVAWLSRCTAEADLDELCFVLPDSSIEFDQLQRLGLRAVPSSYVTTAGSYTPKFHTTRLHGGWYYTLAEFDLC